MISRKIFKITGFLVVASALSLSLCACGVEPVDYASIYAESDDPLNEIYWTYYENHHGNAVYSYISGEEDFQAASIDYVNRLFDERDWEKLSDYTDELKNYWDVCPDYIKEVVDERMDELMEGAVSVYDPTNATGYYAGNAEQEESYEDDEDFKHTVYTYYYGDLSVVEDCWWNPFALYETKDTKGIITDLYYQGKILYPSPYGALEGKGDGGLGYRDKEKGEVNLSNYYLANNCLIHDEADQWVIYDIDAAKDHDDLGGDEILKF